MYSSFERNIWVEIQAEEFANAPYINHLNLRSMGIFTVNSKAFHGMTALKRLYVLVYIFIDY